MKLTQLDFLSLAAQVVNLLIRRLAIAALMFLFVTSQVFAQSDLLSTVGESAG